MWRNEHMLHMLRENMENKYISDSTATVASTLKIEIDSIPTDFTYMCLFCRIRENVYVKILTYI